MKKVIYLLIVLIFANSLLFMNEMKANNINSFHFSYIKKIDNIPKDYKFLITMQYIYDINIEQCRKIFENDNIASINYVNCKDMVDVISANIKNNQ